MVSEAAGNGDRHTRLSGLCQVRQKRLLNRFMSSDSRPVGPGRDRRLLVAVVTEALSQEEESTIVADEIKRLY